MNSQKFILATALAGGLFSASVLTAEPQSQTAHESAFDQAPKPVSVVMPSGLLPRYEGATVRIKLTIDESGRPHEVSLLSDHSLNLTQNLLPAVKRWVFAPALKNGQPVAVVAELPVQLVDIPSR